MKYKFLFLLLIFFGASNMSSAQNLEELISISFENNLEIKTLEKEHLAAFEKAPQVSELSDPELAVGAYPLPVETRLGAQAVRFSGTQMFPWPGTLDEKKELELAKAKPILEKIEARKLELEYEVKKAFFELYEMEKRQAILAKNIGLFESLERLALAKVESGKATIADVLTVQLKLEEIKKELEILEVKKAQPIFSINQLLNRDLHTSINISDSLIFSELPFDKNNLMENIPDNHPMLRMYDFQQNIFQKNIALNELNGKPTFGVGLDYIVVGKRDDAEPANNGRDILQLRAAVKIPIYRKKYEAKEREENLKIEMLENQKSDALTKFNSTIEKIYTEHETLKIKMELYEWQKEILSSAIQVLESQYSAEGNKFEELLRLEKELVDYDLKILKTIVDSHIYRSNIERFVF